ncbi:MAG: aminotransferase class IV [Pseudomonadota bacterium]
MIVYVNGDYHPHGPLIDSRDRGFLLADGVFETLLVRSGHALFLDAHIGRLNRACKALSIDFSGEPATVSRIFNGLTGQNDLRGVDAAGRITITRGHGARGLLFDPSATPTVVVSLAPLPPIKPHWQWQISSIVRPSFALTSAMKTLGYMENILAANEAASAGCDEAVMLNERGNAACGCRANLFLIMADEKGKEALLTPPIADGALPGITRATAMSLAAKAGIAVREASLTPAMLEAGFVFFTNSLHGLVAGTRGGQPYPESDMFRTLKVAYDRTCDDEEKRDE